MKEDYLWDKTGEDREIETLESKLAAFRYKPDAPPALPIATPESPSRGLWGLRLIFVPALAALLVGAAGLGIWLRGTSTGPAVEIANRVEMQPEPVDIQATIHDTSQRPELRDPISPRRDGGRQAADRISMSSVKHSIRPTPKTSQAKLTREEKYAYDRLMLALSITGSKLRLVQDKVNGTELQKAETTNNK